MDSSPALGATYLEDGRCQFLLWSPYHEPKLKLFGREGDGIVPMTPQPQGYYSAIPEDIAPGTRYAYQIEGMELPDPVSRYQPDGVHRPSAVVRPDYTWSDQGWTGVKLEDLFLYELHVGTFTQEGTFEAIIPHLSELADLGVTAIELMPVSQFPGNRNWGYDGVHHFAPQNTYGEPEGLRKLVDACHAEGLGVFMDVVYNHFGPEGNYLAKFGPYFTDRYHTPWGAAVNFDSEHSDEVRRFVIENAVYWIREFHMDGLRLDAVQTIYDFSPLHILEELTAAVKREGERLQREVLVIAESCVNDAKLVRRRERGGYGLDGEWSDDFQYSLRTLFTPGESGLYSDFDGYADLVRAMSSGYAYEGRYSAFRKKRHGSSASDIPPDRLVVYAQNHDQVGNRMLGDRLSEHVSFEQLKLTAATVLLSPYRPFLFMGEEYGETARFPYFISHQDPGLVNAVRRGRKQEYARFQWKGSPPDPQAESTFESAKLNHPLKNSGEHQLLWKFHQALIRLRKDRPSLRSVTREEIEVLELADHVMGVRRTKEGEETYLVLNFSGEDYAVELPDGSWQCLLQSASQDWGGPGAEEGVVRAASAALYVRQS